MNRRFDSAQPGRALKQQCQRPSSRTDVHRLPEAVQHQHMLVEHSTHNQFQLAQNYTMPRGVSTQREQTGLHENP